MSTCYTRFLHITIPLKMIEHDFTWSATDNDSDIQLEFLRAAEKRGFVFEQQLGRHFHNWKLTALGHKQISQSSILVRPSLVMQPPICKALEDAEMFTSKSDICLRLHRF